MSQKTKKAFSLIELSIVILIIGLLVAGVVKGQQLYRKMQLTSAQNITVSSPVNRTADLKMWLETSLKSSFVNNINDGDLVAIWNDQKLDQKSVISPSQSTQANKPTFKENVYNGIPGLKFDGTNDYLPYDGSFLVNSDYTIFVVDMRGSNKSQNYFIGGSGGSPNSILHLGYRSASAVTQAHYFNDMDVTITPTIGINQIYLHVFRFSKTEGKFYRFYQNDHSLNYGDAEQTSPLVAYNGFVGRGGGVNYYNGHLFEIIVFKRALKNNEREAIENYLGQKYSIKIVR